MSAFSTPVQPAPWWNLSRRIQEHYAHVERLGTLVDLYRQVRDAEQRGRGLEDQLRRCRDWNSALLKEKAGWAGEIERWKERVRHLEARVDEAARAVVDSETRAERLGKQLDAQGQEASIQAADLQRALKRCDDLRARLKSPSRRKR